MTNILQYKNIHGKWERATEPPITKKIPDINRFLTERLKTEYPNHTQNVERHVKITTEVTAAVSGHERQVGEGLAKLKGTAMIPRRVVRKTWDSTVFNRP